LGGLKQKINPEDRETYRQVRNMPYTKSLTRTTLNIYRRNVVFQITSKYLDGSKYTRTGRHFFKSAHKIIKINQNQNDCTKYGTDPSHKVPLKSVP
jgi:hypothetical protein